MRYKTLVRSVFGGMDKPTVVAVWTGIIFLYYIVATLLPIDKIIGRIYPLFADYYYSCLPVWYMA